MQVRAIVCDWHGTLIEADEDQPLFEYIGIRQAALSFPAPVIKGILPTDRHRAMLKVAHALDGNRWRFNEKLVNQMLRAQRKVVPIYNTCQDDRCERTIRALYDGFNKYMITGLEEAWIKQMAEEFAEHFAAPNVDHNLVAAVRRAESPAFRGILSTGYDHAIAATLHHAGCDQLFDTVTANSLAADNDQAIGFQLDILDNKAAVLARLLEQRSIPPADAVYIGDDPLFDGDCFELVGHPVVAPLASNEARQLIAEKYNARTPHDSTESMLAAISKD